MYTAKTTLIKDITIVNEGCRQEGSVLIENGKISRIMLSGPEYAEKVSHKCY